MAGDHGFLDESKRSSYTVVVALVPAPELDGVRRGLRTLLLPGQRALHFKSEQDGRRRQILTAMCGLPIRAQVYVSDQKQATIARHACLTAAVEDLARMEAERLVLELSDGDLAADRRTLSGATRKVDTELRYAHMRAPQEPCLWAADAIAWAYARGGVWAQRAQPLIGLVTEV